MALRPARIAIAVAAASLALAGCGDAESESADSGGGGSGTGTTTVAVTDTLPTTAEPAVDRSCGGIAGQGASIFEIEVANIGCRAAREIAAEWRRTCEGESCRVIGFDCSREILGPEEMEVTCRREGGLVRFLYGV